jgi:hypothetical protein
VRMHRPAPADLWEEDELWRWLDGKADHHDKVVMSIEYRVTDAGADDVELFAVTHGLGLRRKLLPEGERPRHPAENIGVQVHRRDERYAGPASFREAGHPNVEAAKDLAWTDPALVALLGKRWGAVIKPRPGRQGRDPRYYAMVARDYVRALEVEPATPIRWMVETANLRGEKVTADQLRARVRRARKEHEFLTAPPKGRSGGRLTAKAKRVLREAGQEVM